MNRLILAGGSGFLGRALARHFQNGPWEIVILSRSPRSISGQIRETGWDASTLGPWRAELNGATAVLNLTGRTVNCRYNARNRKEILASRVDSTRVLGEAIASCPTAPRVWLNASTATLYKHSVDTPMDETSAIEATDEAKDAFSVEVGKAWERGLDEAATPRTRKVSLRMAMVLGLAMNSVFPTLRKLVRLGLGGKMGDGGQYVSWIHEADFCRAIEWLISHDELQGPVNITAPNPVPNREMMRILRQIYRAPFGLPAAEWMLEVGAFLMRTETELILKSRRVVPRRLLESGFKFEYPLMGAAFEELSQRGCLTQSSHPPSPRLGRT